MSSDDLAREIVGTRRRKAARGSASPRGPPKKKQKTSPRDSRSASSSRGPPKKKQRGKQQQQFQQQQLQQRPQEETLAKTQKTKQVVVRPGVPPETPKEELQYPDRLSPPPRPDDAAGYYTYVCGENLTPRYKILSKLGEGTFGMVLECWDRVTRSYVAVKVIRNIDKYRRAAMVELEVLNSIDQNDVEGQWHCVRLLHWFDYRDHVCMVFSKLGPSLFDFLQRNGYRPFHVNLVRHFGLQILEAVAYMHDLSLIHTDLKPENILLEKEGYERRSSSPSSRSGKRVPISSDLKVIDFGSATFSDAYHSHIVSTRHYRAPEIILGHGWSFPCDIWSVGAILVELISGETLFQTHENLEHLAMMEQVLGPIPESMAKKVNRQTEKYFVRGRLNWPEGAQSRKNIRSVRKLSDLKSHIQELGEPSVRPHLDSFIDLVRGMLQYDPEKRLTAREALKHEFFQIPMDGKASTPIA